MPELLLYGATGQLGLAITKEFSNNGWRITAPSRVEFNFCEADQYLEVSSLDMYDAVINCVALHDLRTCMEMPNTAFRINAVAPGAIAKQCGSRGVPFVHISTDYVFGGRNPNYEIYNEPGPKSVYGISKLAGEFMVRAATPYHIIVRTAALFGGRSSGKGPTLVDRVLANPDGDWQIVADCATSFGYVPDVAAGIRIQLEGSRWGTHHIVNSGVNSWHEFIRRAAYMKYGYAYQIGYKPWVNEFGRPQFSGLKPTMAMRGWEAALKEYIQGHD